MSGILDFGLLFSEADVERCGWVLIHSLWQFALIALLAVIANRVLRQHTAVARYAVLVALMALSIVFPALTWMLQPNDSAVVVSAQKIDASGQVRPILTEPEFNDPVVTETDSDRRAVDKKLIRSTPIVPVASIGDHPSDSSNRVGQTMEPDRAHSRSTWTQQATELVRPWFAWMVGFWLIGVALCLLRPLMGLITLRRLKRTGVATASKDILASLARISERMGLRRSVRVFESSLAQVPMVVGYLQPVILLPISLLTHIPATQLESILAHELAHIRRHDFIVNLLQILMETLFFYHPGIWWLSNRIRVEREHCCDDTVIKVIADRVEYGRALIAIEELRGRNTLLSLGASDGSMIQRIRRIAGHPSERTGAGWWSALIVVSLAGAVLFMSLMSHEGVAATGENESIDGPSPISSPNHLRSATAPTTVATVATDELEFLAGYPKLQELSLEMTEQQFLEIVARHNLKAEKTVEGGNRHFLIPADDDHSVIVMFGNNGDKCSGIQRIRADNRLQGLRTLREPAFHLPGHSNMVLVDFENNDTELVAVSAYHFATIRRWDLVHKKLKNEVKLSSDQHLRPFRQGTLKLSGDGRRVIGATDEFVGIWDTTTGELLKKLPFPKKEWEYDCIGKLDCTPDLSVIVGHLTTSYTRSTRFYDARVIVWDVDSGESGRIITDMHASELMAIDLSNDGELLATTNGGRAKIWDTGTGKLRHSIPNDNSDRKDLDPEHQRWTHHVWSVQLSPNGKQLAVGDILGVKLWDTQSGELLHRLDAPYQYSNGTASLVFSKDGERLARTGTSGKTKGSIVPIWSTRTGEKLFEIHTRAYSGTFSDDGQRFAVGLSDRKIALAVWQLYGKASDADIAFKPQPEPLQDKVGVGSHYVGKKADEFVQKWKPTWGEPQLGIQLGIALTSPQHRFQAGQRVPLVIFFRNVGDRPQQLDIRPDLFWNTPNVFNANGEEIELEKVALLGSTAHYRDELQPGEAFGPLYLSFGLGENPRPGIRNWDPYSKTPVAGMHKLTQTVLFNVADPDEGDRSLKEDWKQGELTSGEIKFEIVERVQR